MYFLAPRAGQPARFLGMVYRLIDAPTLAPDATLVAYVDASGAPNVRLWWLSRERVNAWGERKRTTVQPCGIVVCPD